MSNSLQGLMKQGLGLGATTGSKGLGLGVQEGDNDTREFRYAQETYFAVFVLMILE